MRLGAWLRGTQRRSHNRQSELEAKSLAAPEAWLVELFGASPSASGVAVTAKTAMSCAPVRCAVQSIAEATGQLPAHVYQRGDDGSKERAPDHPAYALLHDQANDWTPASTFREELTRDALLHPGGGFAFINRVEGGKPVELIRLDPEETPVTIERGAGGEPFYKVHERGKGPRIIDRRNILHIPSPSLNGCGLVHDAREAIGLALVLEQHAAKLFGNGAKPSGVLSFKSKLGPDVVARIRTAWQAMHGNGNTGKVAILEEGAEYQSVALNSVDSQFLELRQYSVAEIARVFRVPPILLMDYGRATWSNSEVVGQQFLTFTLLPWIKRWEGECRLKLLTDEERASRSHLVEFFVDDLLRADFEKRMQGYSAAIAARILNPNEARAAENRPPYDGGDKFENPNTTTGAQNADA